MKSKNRNKNYSLIVYTLLIFNGHFLFAMNCGSIILSTQGQIDSFSVHNPGCTELDDVQIEGANIINIDGLTSVTKIRNLFITRNPNLQSISGLNNLEEVELGILISENDNLTNLNGFTSLKYIGQNLSIQENQNLISIDGFNNLDSIRYQLNVFNHEDLVEIGGFEKLIQLGDVLNIQGNSILTDISSLNDISIQKLIIVNNPLLSECSLTSICNFFSGYDKSCPFYLLFGNAGNCISPQVIVQHCGLTACGEHNWIGCVNSSFWSLSNQWEKFLLPTECSEVIIGTEDFVEVNINACIYTLRVDKGGVLNIPLGKEFHVLGPESCE